jgi:serine/threonine protein kinase
VALGSEDTLIARLVVERQLVTAEELRQAAEYRRQKLEDGEELTLAKALIALGLLTQSQLKRIRGVAMEDSSGRPTQQIPGFQIQKKVGAGAMAVVYRAKQLSLDRTVAIKILPRRMSENPEFVERFQKEGRAAAQLNHNNIVQAIDVGEAGGYHYFVMEFVDGCTVYDELFGGKVYTEEEAIKIVRQVAEALLHSHERGFIHRDVKPKNIMLTKDRVTKLADMGLAREMNDYDAAMAEAGRAYGTPYYISPEQIRGEVNIDHRADIYSLGATFYHMVTGRVPFEAPSPPAVMHKHLKEPLTPPDHINTALTSGCGAMIEMMMAKNPEERYPSCKELVSDLKLLARGESPHFARQGLDHDVLDTLSSGIVVDQGEAPPPPATNQTWLIVLGVVAGLSVLLNLILALT